MFPRHRGLVAFKALVSLSTSPFTPGAPYRVAVPYAPRPAGHPATKCHLRRDHRMETSAGPRSATAAGVLGTGLDLIAC